MCVSVCLWVCFCLGCPALPAHMKVLTGSMDTLPRCINEEAEDDEAGPADVVDSQVEGEQESDEGSVEGDTQTCTQEVEEEGEEDEVGAGPGIMAGIMGYNFM